MQSKIGAEHLEQVPSLAHRPDGVFRVARTAGRPNRCRGCRDRRRDRRRRMRDQARRLEVLDQDWEDAFVEKCPGCVTAVAAQS